MKEWFIEKIAGVVDGVKFVSLTVPLRGCCELRLNDDGVADLRRMYVAEECQRQGIGTALFERSVQEAREAGCHSLCFSVRRANSVAIQFYTNFGAHTFGGDKDDLFMTVYWEGAAAL